MVFVLCMSPVKVQMSIHINIYKKSVLDCHNIYLYWVTANSCTKVTISSNCPKETLWNKTRMENQAINKYVTEKLLSGYERPEFPLERITKHNKSSRYIEQQLYWQRVDVKQTSHVITTVAITKSFLCQVILASPHTTLTIAAITASGDLHLPALQTILISSCTCRYTLVCKSPGTWL